MEPINRVEGAPHNKSPAAVMGDRLRVGSSIDQLGNMGYS